MCANIIGKKLKKNYTGQSNSGKKKKEAIPTENLNPIRMEGKLRVKHYMGTTEPVKTNSLSPERVQIAKIFKVHIEKAIFEELSTGYEVTLQGRFDTTLIRIEIEVSSSEKEILNACGVVPEGTMLKQEAHTF